MYDRTEDKAWAITLHDGDDVAVMASTGVAGQNCIIRGPSGQAEITLTTDVPFAHKVALRALKAGDVVKKFGYPIAKMSCDVPAGSHIHTHNVAGARATLRGKE